MFSELYKAISAVGRVLLFPAPTLILLPQPPAVSVLFDLLRADSNLWGRGGVIREAEKVPAELISNKYRVKYCQVPKPEILFLA